jgi:hypothetical protein
MEGVPMTAEPTAVTEETAVNEAATLVIFLFVLNRFLYG